jgi:hypothetical protein
MKFGRLIWLAVALLAADGARAGCTLMGTVKDNTGAVMPGDQTATNEASA